MHIWFKGARKSAVSNGVARYFSDVPVIAGIVRRAGLDSSFLCGHSNMYLSPVNVVKLPYTKRRTKRFDAVWPAVVNFWSTQNQMATCLSSVTSGVSADLVLFSQDVHDEMCKDIKRTQWQDRKACICLASAVKYGLSEFRRNEKLYLLWIVILLKTENETWIIKSKETKSVEELTWVSSYLWSCYLC